MMQRMQDYALVRPEKRLNEWNEQVTEWAAAGTIRAAVSLASGSRSEQNQILRIESTHTGITYDDVRVGDRFSGYEVTYVAEGSRRMKMLWLKRDDAVSEAVEG